MDEKDSDVHLTPGIANQDPGQSSQVQVDKGQPVKQNPNDKVQQTTEPHLSEEATSNNEPKKTSKRSAVKKIFIVVVFLIFGIILIGYLLMRDSGESSEDIYDQGLTEDSAGQAAYNDLSNTPGDCTLFWVDPILPPEGEIEPLFMRPSVSITEEYEAIIRRQVGDNKVLIDVVTNQLPEENGSYHLLSLGVNKEGVVCFQDNLGELEIIPDTKVWGIGGLSKEIDTVNDAEVFVITQNGFGVSNNDIIDDLDHPSIILLGTYMTNHQ